jgi:hypothetical protein
MNSRRVSTAVFFFSNLNFCRLILDTSRLMKARKPSLKLACMILMLKRKKDLLIHLSREPLTMVSGSVGSGMVGESRSGQMVLSTKDSGRIIGLTAKVGLFTSMEISMMASG